MIQRRIDRYSTPQNVNDVYFYLGQRIHEFMVLLQVPGFYHAKFRAGFKALANLDTDSLHTELHNLCQRYDKSNQVQFGKFKSRIRRYLYTKHGQVTLKVSSKVSEQLDTLVREESLADVNEAVEQLLVIKKLYQAESAANLSGELE